ncbi:hypothetical protein [Bacillus albus]|nr:hypothetical protein [Bacillus albus]MED2847518.1 hypothetical protein [Bacillus thuringiensis]
MSLVRLHVASMPLEAGAVPYIDTLSYMPCWYAHALSATTMRTV